MEPAPGPRAGRALLLRRTAALAYDLLVVAALWMATGFLVLPLTGGEAVPAGTGWFRALLLAVACAFFVVFWARGGQTAGMRAWRLRLVRSDGSPVGWRRALARFAVACLSLAALGLGALWAVGDPQGRTWQDRLADTRVILVSKES